MDGWMVGSSKMRRMADIGDFFSQIRELWINQAEIVNLFQPLLCQANTYLGISVSILWGRSCPTLFIMMGNGSSCVNYYFGDKQVLAPITEQRIQESMTPNYVEEHMQIKFQEVAQAINNSLPEKVPEVIVISDDEKEEEEKPPQAAHCQAQPFKASPTFEQAATTLLQFQIFNPREERIWCYFDPEGYVQGPLSLNTLKLWRDAGFYPAHLRVWKVDRLDSSISLTDLILEWFP